MFYADKVLLEGIRDQQTNDMEFEVLERAIEYLEFSGAFDDGENND